MSPDGEPSPKRQRLESYSPASPPVLAETKGFVQQPQTPPPSVHMSPSWQAQAHPAEQQSGPGSVTFPTPPSTSGFLGGQRSFGGAEEGAESGQHTPAPEGEVKNDGDMDAEMRDSGHEGSAVLPADGDVSMEGVADDAEHRRTDHERQGGQEDSMPATMPPPPAPRLYKLCTQPIAHSRPHPSSNLMNLYSLQTIQASVARKDAAGKKINKLRKSYEGKVKAMNLEGRFKPTVKDKELYGLLDPDWDADMGGGETLWQQQRGGVLLSADAAMTGDLLAKLDVATSLRPGTLPKAEHKEWKDMLAPPDEPAKGGTPATTATKLGSLAKPVGLAKTTAGTTLRASAPASPRRPERSGKKRRYDDSSFDGYQQTYDDEAGYSTGGVDDTSSRRSSGIGGGGIKRQKVGGGTSSLLGVKSS